MRKIDEITINQRGVPSNILMEKAGSVVYEFIINNTENINDKKVLVVAGGGNNGGDSLVAARLLIKHDISVKVFIIGGKNNLSKDSEINYEFLLKTGLKPEFLNGEKDLNLLNKHLKEADIIVDGIFGTGLNKPVKGFHAAVIELINKSGKEIVAVDIPSGVSSDTGGILGTAVKANYTVTFGLPKPGHFLLSGLTYRGKLIVENIGFGKDLLEDSGIKNNLINKDMAADFLPKRAPDAHKGTCGKVLVVGGSPSYFGAPFLAAEASLRTGAGLAGVCLPQELACCGRARSLEVIVHPVKSKDGGFSFKSFNEVKDISRNYDAMVLGPGIGRTNDAVKLAGKIIKEIDIPKVVDADALYALSLLKNIRSKSDWVLTPHPGEFSRLVKKSVEEVNKNLLKNIKEVCAKYNSIVIYKRYNTVTAVKDEFYVNGSGNSALATAGSGDVLSGMIAGFAAQGLPLSRASILAVYLHGLCADEYIKENDVLGMLAGDIIGLLPKVIKQIRNK